MKPVACRSWRFPGFGMGLAKDKCLTSSLQMIHRAGAVGSAVQIILRRRFSEHPGNPDPEGRA